MVRGKHHTEFYTFFYHTAKRYLCLELQPNGLGLFFMSFFEKTAVVTLLYRASSSHVLIGSMALGYIAQVRLVKVFTNWEAK